MISDRNPMMPLRATEKPHGDQAGLPLALERAATRAHLVQDRAERKDVGARVGVEALQLLGRHVLQRADDAAVRRQVARRRESDRSRGCARS
jgi:hypothetical protein